MSILSGFKLVLAKRTSDLSSTEVRRIRLAGKLDDQISLAHAIGDGCTFEPKVKRRIKDRVTGEVVMKDVTKRIRQWWFNGENGKVCVQIRYGTRIIDFAKGKNSIELDKPGDLILVLDKLRSAAIAGELDAQLAAASEGVKARFKK